MKDNHDFRVNIPAILQQEGAYSVPDANIVLQNHEIVENNHVLTTQVHPHREWFVPFRCNWHAD